MAQVSIAHRKYTGNLQSRDTSLLDILDGTYGVRIPCNQFESLRFDEKLEKMHN